MFFQKWFRFLLLKNSFSRFVEWGSGEAKRKRLKKDSSYISNILIRCFYENVKHAG